MKTRTTFIFIFLVFAILGCEHDDKPSIPTIDGLSLYWDHEVFGAEGRRLRFECSTTNEFDNHYELEFNTSVVDKTITIRLTKAIDKGKCQFFPMPGAANNHSNKCNASGEFYITDKELKNGDYSLKLIMPDFEVTSDMTVTSEKVTLAIPTNTFFKSSIENVYPVPPNLLFGSVVYQGSSNTNDAENFLDYLTDLGLIQTTVRNYSYRHLTVDDNGYPSASHWEPDNHSIGFLFKMNSTDFHTIFEESKKYFNQKNLNINLYTSNGDQGLMSKTEGITVAYPE